jgi:hypothetical protein
VSVSPVPSPTPPSALPAPKGLPVIDYGPAPDGFPGDPDPASTNQLTAAAHPETRIPAYDALGGQPKAFLDPTINGVPITMPIVEKKLGWVAILLPSVNRTIGWLAPTGWTEVDLRDQLVIQRGRHQMSWFREGVLQKSWPVTLGLPQTPTPLGRTFILGRSRLPGSVYAGVDVMALGAVPDEVNALPAGLRGAHIGIHTWHNDHTLGTDASDGCIRLTKSGQQLLLSEVIPGSPVVVID